MDVVWFIPRMLSRILFPKMLDRYVLGELLGPLIFGWTLFIVLFVFSVSLFKLATLLARGARPELVAEMLALKVVLSSVYCLPMAMLLSGLLAFGRLSGDSELIATQAGGIANIRPIRNAFILGLLLSFVGLALNEYVIPPAGRQFHHIEMIVKAELKMEIQAMMAEQQKAFIIPDYEKGRLARLVAAKKYHPEEGSRPATMEDVTYIQYDDKGEWNTIISAREAVWIGEKRWRFKDADTQFRHDLLKEKKMDWHSSTMELTIQSNPKVIEDDAKDPDEMSYKELKNYISLLEVQNPDDKKLGEFKVDLDRKLAIPFAAMVFALVGAPLGVRRQRSTAGVGIGLSLLIIIAYYVGMSLLGVMGTGGTIPTLAAAWGCNVIGTCIGLMLTWRASR